jgi:hypothetical protein
MRRPLGQMLSHAGSGFATTQNHLPVPSKESYLSWWTSDKERVCFRVEYPRILDTSSTILYMIRCILKLSANRSDQQL